jgi:hypothetical protein
VQRNITYILLGILFLQAPLVSFSQEQTDNYSQLWLDFMLQKTFQNSVRYFATTGPRFLLNEQSSWSQYELSQSLHYNIIGTTDAIGGLLLNYTQQTDTTNLYNSYEIRPWLGARIHFNPNSKLMVSLFSRIEYRNLFYNNQDSVQQSFRMRNRLEFTYSINKPNFYQDNLWYVTLDGDWYLPLSENPDERFANLARFRAGVGYRKNYNWRYVIILTEQFSRNTIDEGFKSSHFIIDFRVHLFIPAKTKE